jgi:hypothetical protein
MTCTARTNSLSTVGFGPLSIALHLAFFCTSLVTTACGPGGSDVAPAFVIVDPGAVDFQPGEDTETLLVQNTGEVAASVTIKVAAEDNGVNWLEVEPSSVALAGGAAKALSVRVINRTELVPDTYDGSLTVEVLGMDSVTVPVTLTVGQPVLSIEPLDILDYADLVETLPLVIKNTGTGRLVYAVKLPGPWMSTDEVLQKEILSNEPQTLELRIDRAEVPWYGENTIPLLVTSNGQENDEHSSTAAIPVRVIVDSNCEVDANCLREGYYCDNSGNEGTCKLRKELGQACSVAGACISGYCQQGICCETVCEADCWSCANTGSEGVCSAVADGTDCNDENFCTVDDQCSSGECLGMENDCGDLKAECIDAVCSVIGQECVPLNLDDGLECDDEDPCTSSDTCEGGLCGGLDKDCSPLEEGNSCRHAWCDPASEPIPGECVVADVKNGESCVDGFFCVVDEVCVDGICQGSAYECPVKQCAQAQCQEEPPGCTYSGDLQQVGDSCDDEDICTDETVCTAGGDCGAGDPVTGEECDSILDNGNPCVQGVCDPVDGCYLELLDDGTDCPLDNATAQCLQGQCLLIKCEDGWGNCDNDLDDGCEHDVTDDLDNCGECTNVCPDVADATVGCVDSECAITECDGHAGDCDGKLESGCESDLWTDIDHCGECDDPCVKADFFANADVECAVGDCLFLGCHTGFEDSNDNCVAGKNCLDGCEACQPVGDGLTDIPDDGLDSDCDGEDTVNDESRGYYVDGSFPFGGECPQPGTGSRSCPFKHPQSAVEAMEAQDWSDPYVVMREVYIAQGEYYGAAPVVAITRPIQLAGGYTRTDEGPWARSSDHTLTTIEGDGGCVVEVNNVSTLWAAVDGLSLVSKDLCFTGGVFVNNADLGGAFASTASTLWLQDSKAGPISGVSAASNWNIQNCDLVSLSLKTASSKNGYVVGNTISKSVTLQGDDHTLLNNDIGGSVHFSKHGHEYVGNTIAGAVTGVALSGGGSGDNLVLTNNTIGSGLNGKGGEGWKLVGNTILSGGIVGQSGATLSSNHIVGSVTGGVYTSNIVGNTIVGNVSNIFAGCNFYDNRIEGAVTMHADATRFIRNIILGNVVGNGTGWEPVVLKSNLITGSVYVKNRAVIVHNTVYADNSKDYALFLGSDEIHVIGNIFYWSGGVGETRYGVKEGSANDDPWAFYKNVFIGFGQPGGVLFLDESTIEVTDVEVLNNLSFSCGSGDNLSFASKLAGEFVSISPSAEGFMMPTADSPFLDQGPAFPVDCGGQVISAFTKDLTGQAMPCGDGADIGCYEYCQDN